MASPYDAVMKKYKIPKSQIYHILSDPEDAMKTIHRKKEGIVEIIKI